MGATASCLQHCYAQKGHFQRAAVRNKYAYNYEMTLRPDFQFIMRRELRQINCSCVRIHASGEFYSAEYVNKWAAIAEQASSVTFFAYTRSWNNDKPGLLDALFRFSQLPNVFLWFSCDSHTGEPPDFLGIRRAFMMLSDSDVPNWPVDLFFRVSKKIVRKKIGSTLVCPAENGVTETTCGKCKLCSSYNTVTLQRATSP